MREITSVASSMVTLLEHLKNELIKAFDNEETDLTIEISVNLNDPKMGTFYIWSETDKKTSDAKDE